MSHEVHMCPPCSGNCCQGRACPARQQKEERGVPGGGIVRAIGWVAFAAFLGNLLAQVWRA